MKRIAFWKALQFNVYDLGNGKVLKKPKKKWQMFLVNLSWQPYLIFTPWIIMTKINIATRERSDAMKYFSSNKFNKKRLANLEIKNNQAIQDKVVPLNQVLGKSVSHDKKLIDAYIKFVFDCWRSGYSERVYKFVENHAINKKGDLVLMDFGEMCFSKGEVTRTIKEKFWRAVFSNKIGLKKNARKYFYQKLEESFTLKTLNKYWNK